MCLLRVSSFWAEMIHTDSTPPAQKVQKRPTQGPKRLEYAALHNHTVRAGEYHSGYVVLQTGKLRSRNVNLLIQGQAAWWYCHFKAFWHRGKHGLNHNFFAFDFPTISSSSYPLSVPSLLPKCSPWLFGMKETLLYHPTNLPVLPQWPQLVFLVPIPCTPSASGENSTGQLVHSIHLSWPRLQQLLANL